MPNWISSSSYFSITFTLSKAAEIGESIDNVHPASSLTLVATKIQIHHKSKALATAKRPKMLAQAASMLVAAAWQDSSSLGSLSATWEVDTSMQETMAMNNSVVHFPQQGKVQHKIILMACQAEACVRTEFPTWWTGRWAFGSGSNVGSQFVCHTLAWKPHQWSRSCAKQHSTHWWRRDAVIDGMPYSGVINCELEMGGSSPPLQNVHRGLARSSFAAFQIASLWWVPTKEQKQ